MAGLKFRTLSAEEIECRVQTVKSNGVSLLLYKDARVDQNILDETVGPLNWQRSHQIIGDRLYCTVSVWDENKKQWISKQDVGTESNTEKEKGQASDSFKRACFNLGIGRELYTSPFIWVNKNDCDIKPKGNGFTCYDKFSVKEINIDGGKITGLVIINEKTNRVVFKMGDTKPQKATEQVAVNPEEILMGENHKRSIVAMCGRKGLSTQGLQRRAGKTFDQWNMNDYKEFMEKLEACPDKQATEDLGL